MTKTNEIIAYQRKQEELKKEIKKIKETLPTYLIGFISVSISFTLFICVIYFYLSLNKLKKKRKLSKDIQSKLYHLMKLENE